MLTLNSEIVIGGKRFGGVHEVTVKRSVYEPGATATIRVPVTAVLKRNGQPGTRIETAQAVKTGDRVVIRLGYDGRLNTEFTGWVKQRNLATPFEIVCEDEFYQCRRRSVSLSGKMTLSEILKACGLKVGYCAELTVEAFQVASKPVAWVLAKLKSEYGLCIYFDLEGRVYACREYGVTTGRVKYVLRENVISDDQMMYQRAEDVRLKIKAVCVYRDGSVVEAETGADDGTEKKVYFYNVRDRAELSALAAAELERHCYTGYTGRIETFLLPYVLPCMRAEVCDGVYSERDGVYFVRSVETKFGINGGRRVVEIGIKL